ncbi:NAD(P)/FAD-dependent oxidoreductase [Xylanimonas protaetiae]|uniref:FAD-dependent oxidoreductase n=1 Tax=Xylanimonas protaetiae TaxID=2509457 RepID=A0A4P6FC88_9MICO|nr:FAD-dependent oxidoreductase [Xylanimonas protaetiae]QAY71157.1 FAD-dependent oxidoreductase [Xylanimonas protaetiae]
MPTQVLVLGGGYAGVMAANRLTRRPDVAVTLVNPRPHFVERIRLHQLAAGTHPAAQELAHVLADAVRVEVGEADRIDAAARTVALTDGATLPYDYLVYAVGSRGSDGGVPGVAEHAFPISTFEAATRLHATLGRRGDVPVVVVGGGPTGIEAAAELAETGHAVTLVCGGHLGPYLRDPARRSVARRLAELGVTVLAGADVARVEADAVVLADGRRLPSGVTVWAAGFEASDLARRSGLAVDDAGRLLTDETLTSVDDPRVVGAGDAVSPSGVPEPMSCQAAIPLGMHAADTVLHRLAGEPARDLANPFVGMCVGLGRATATFQLAHTNDVAVGAYLGGRTGGRLKELVCVQVVESLAREARRPGSTWFPASRARARSLAHPVTHDAAGARVVA